VELTDDTLADLVALAGVAVTFDNVTDAHREICRIAGRAVGHADGASLTLMNADGPEVGAATDGWASQLDEMQYVEHEGPCLDAARSGVLFRVRDAGSDTRWPSYMPRVREAGVLSLLSIPLTVASKTTGALNVYSRSVDAFTPEDVGIAQLIAGHASLAAHVAATVYVHRDLAEGLQVAMASRAAIEQAKGIIMGSAGCNSEVAFERLKQQSQHENRKLREVAEEIVRLQTRRAGPPKAGGTP
jgi:transcriptional regulator with GAF, ATPase, and Fis domain